MVNLMCPSNRKSLMGVSFNQNVHSVSIQQLIDGSCREDWKQQYLENLRKISRCPLSQVWYLFPKRKNTIFHKLILVSNHVRIENLIC